jgi:hypothetical protein
MTDGDLAGAFRMRACARCPVSPETVRNAAWDGWIVGKPWRDVRKSLIRDFKTDL